jgi:selenide,water dikinase
LTLNKAQINVERLISALSSNPGLEVVLLEGAAESIDPDSKIVSVRVTRRDGAEQMFSAKLISVPYDVISIDVGSSAKGFYEVPGAKERVLPTRPLSTLLTGLAEAERTMKLNEKGTFAGSKFSCVVVGGGYAGCELAMSLRGRWEGRAQMTLVTQFAEAIPALVRSKMDRLGITVRTGLVAKEVLEKGIVCSSSTSGASETIASDLVVWATGAAPHNFLVEQAGLSTERARMLTKEGYVAVDKNLASLSHPASIFAAGDCAEMFDRRTDGSLESLHLSKSGVVAVRQGPVLAQNVMSSLDGLSSRTPYVPQKTWLQILNCGDGDGIAIWSTWKFGPSRWVMSWKRTIDERWMSGFR